MEKIYSIKNLDCANCAAKIERALEKTAGIEDISVNFVYSKITLQSDLSDIDEVVATIADKIEPGVIVTPIVKDTKLPKQLHLKKESTCGDGCEIKDNHDHEHSDNDFNKFYFLGLGLFVALIFAETSIYTTILWLVAYLLIGNEVLLKAFKGIKNKQMFDENFLMAIATIGAMAIGEYAEGIAVILFYQVGEYFQDRAVEKSKSSVTSLMNLSVKEANVLINNQVIVKKVEEVSVGQVCVVQVGQQVPLDGVIVSGESYVDTFSLTGESVPRRVQQGNEVMAGFINKDKIIHVQTTKSYENSAVGRILDLVENAASKKSHTEKFITTFSRYYTPIVVGLALVVAFIVPIVLKEPIQDWVYKGLVFLVVSCPCALVLSVPLSYFAGIGRGSKDGILVKGGNYLEALEKIDTVVFDKTGTITKGNFKVVEVKSVLLDEKDFMEKVVLGEMNSHHPIAKSIIDYAKLDKMDVTRITDYHEVAGKGIEVKVDKDQLLLGNIALMQTIDIEPLKPLQYGSVIHVAINKQYAGYIVVADEIKDESIETINGLKKLGINTVMLTGDIKETALSIGNKVGIDIVKYELLPDMKVSEFEQLGDRVAFVGDGINDAPVLTRANVGISMGGLGSDAAIEASDIVLMDDKLSNVVTAIKLAKRTKTIVWENIIFALGIKVVVLILSVFGVANMWIGVFSDVGVALLCVLNAIRLLRVKL